MRGLRSRVRGRGKEAIGYVDRVRGALRTGSVDSLRERVAVLEEEVQECRQLNLRLAELTDVVEELLLPVAARDEARVAAVLEKYSRGL
ncbi:MAG: DUF6752 domain-containing protein [Nocardioidaceae bacterium]